MACKHEAFNKEIYKFECHLGASNESCTNEEECYVENECIAKDKQIKELETKIERLQKLAIEHACGYCLSIDTEYCKKGCKLKKELKLVNEKD